MMESRMPIEFYGGETWATYRGYRIHALSEVLRERLQSYCGLRERLEFWERPADEPHCAMCERIVDAASR